jgi:hypothetical protein
MIKGTATRKSEPAIHCLYTSPPSPGAVAIRQALLCSNYSRFGGISQIALHHPALPSRGVTLPCPRVTLLCFAFALLSLAMPWRCVASHYSAVPLHLSDLRCRCFALRRTARQNFAKQYRCHARHY